MIRVKRTWMRGQREALVSLLSLTLKARKTCQWPIIVSIRKQCTTNKQVDTRIRRRLKSLAKRSIHPKTIFEAVPKNGTATTTFLVAHLILSFEADVYTPGY